MIDSRVVLLYSGVNASDEHRRCVEPDEIVVLANECDFCPILWMDTFNAHNKATYSQILKKLDMVATHDSFSSPLTSYFPCRYR